jgi:hypothetical protein
VISAAAAAALPFALPGLPCNLLGISAALDPHGRYWMSHKGDWSRGAFQTCSEPVLNLFHFSRLRATHPFIMSMDVISLFHETFEAAFGFEMNLFWTEPLPSSPSPGSPAQKPKIELRFERGTLHFQTQLKNTFQYIEAPPNEPHNSGLCKTGPHGPGSSVIFNTGSWCCLNVPHLSVSRSDGGR